MPKPETTARRETLRRLCAGGLALSLPSLVTGPLLMSGCGSALAEPAEVPELFTVPQLIKKLEKRFPEILAGEGALSAPDGVTSDLLPATNPGVLLETLGPPEAVRAFRYSFPAESANKAEHTQNRAWAGLIVRNAVSGWPKANSWTRRATVEAERNPGEEISETAEGFAIVVENRNGRIVVAVTPVEINDTDTPGLGVARAQLLDGLEAAFPQRDEGMGSLFGGPGLISDRYFSDNAHAELEVLGPAKEVIALRYLYALREDDHPAATRDNRGYAFALLRNVFPDWPEAEDWLQAAIDETERKADRMAEPAMIERNGIEVLVTFFVGATASIELKIRPKDSYI